MVPDKDHNLDSNEAVGGALIKICGLKEIDHAIVAARTGADFLGFVFVPKSLRAISPEAAEEIVLEVKQASLEEGFALPKFVGLFINAGESLLAETAPFLTQFQFHGQEDAERVAQVGLEFGLDTIKAIGVEGPGDLGGVDEFVDAADILLFDAKPPKGAAVTGGRGVAFDWSALAGYTVDIPFLVAGGLNTENVGDAIDAVKAIPGFLGVDVSSGVEQSPGHKSPDAIAAFIAAVRQS